MINQKIRPVFSPAETAITGRFDEALRFIEKKQLLDESLWQLFVKQFSDKTDSAQGSWRGEFFGKMMRGACMTYSYTKNPQLYAILENAVKALLETQDELGRITTYTLEKEFSGNCEKGGWDMWVRKYVLVGLEYFYEICSDAVLKRRILRAMKRHIDYIISKVGRGAGKTEITATSNAWGGLASSSIIEPITKLYKITGERRYLDYSEYIAENGFIADGNLISLALENKLFPHQYPQVKAYEMMSCFEGLLELYTITGNEIYYTAVKNFVFKAAEGEMTVTGGLDTNYERFSHAAITQTDMPNEQIHMQETCVCVTWMRLCHKLLLISGDSVYSDYIERTLYNCFYGAINFEDSNIIDILGETIKNGFPFDSYSPLNNERRSIIAGGCLSIGEGRKYGCCAAIGSAGSALPPLISVLNIADGGSAVNFYLNGASFFNTPQKQRAKITISGDYETEGKVTITVECSQTEKFGIFLRIPYWTKFAVIHINGCKKQEYIDSGYAFLEHEWSGKDIISVSFECAVKAVKLNNYLSLTKGPFVLARDERLESNINESVSIITDNKNAVKTVPLGSCGFSYRIGVKAEQTNGKTIPLIDYASAGRYPDKEKSKIRVWLPGSGAN